MIQNVRGVYYSPIHDRAADWDFLAKWQPNVIRLMLPGSSADPASVDVQRIRRVHDTCPEATLLLRVWEVDDRNFQAHEAMVADPQAEAERQLNWWARLFDRAVGVPRPLLMAGLNNETGPEKDNALYAYTEAALHLGLERAVRCGAFVFSVGRPSLPGESQYDMDYFSRLEALFLAGDHAMILHEYMQPEGMYAVWKDDQGNERKDYTYLIGRHARWPMKRVPKIIGEWGIDGILYNRHPDPTYGNSGWRNFKDLWTPDRYADEYVECVRKADPSVIGICPFLSDFSDHKWQSFDLLEAYPQLIARKDLCVKQINDAPQVTTHLPQVIGAGPKPLEPRTFYVAVAAGANLRTGPAVEATKITAAAYGQALTVVGRNDNGDWRQVEVDGQRGWVLAALLSSTPPAPHELPVMPPVQPPDTGDKWARSIAFVLAEEGGLSTDPNDKGNYVNGVFVGTKFGISAKAHPGVDIVNLSVEEAKDIYYASYWQASGANMLPWPMCLAMMDLAVNGGVGRAQEALAAAGDNFLRYMAWRIDWYTRIDDFKLYGAAWLRRCARLMKEAAR